MALHSVHDVREEIGILIEKYMPQSFDCKPTYPKANGKSQSIGSRLLVYDQVEENAESSTKSGSSSSFDM